MAEHCVTVWIDTETKDALGKEVKKLGLTRSQVLRQLIKRWVIQRRAGKKLEPIEELV